jgi:hypothetical protein
VSTTAAGAGRLDLGNVSLVCVETRRPELALFALQRCLRHARFGETRLLGARPRELPAGIAHAPLQDIHSVSDYSRFMVRELGAHFAGTHALIVQWDGFITDPSRWNPAFLDYDYIGAPWPDQEPAVGNGGFSLRSRRLVDALAAMDTPEVHPEDHRICELYRPQLERDFGIRFAPVELARGFSWEAVEPTTPTFGFHAFFNFHRVLDEDELLAYFDQCDTGILYSVPARRLLKKLYRTGMQRAADKLHALRMQGPLKLRLDAIKLRAFARARALAG